MKIHLDTDLGGDIDDLCALALLLAWPGAEMSGITTVIDGEGRRAGYTRYALALAGRPEIPVAAGAGASCGRFRFPAGLPDEKAYWPEPIPAAPGPVAEALALLRRSVEAGARIVAIGPYTNLALLDEAHPGILAGVEMYLMGGHVHAMPAGFPDWDNTMDFNVQFDTTSARRILERYSPTLVPIEVTAQTALRRAHLPTLRASGPLGRLLARQAEAFAADERYDERYGRTCAGLPDDLVNFQHDPLACAAALGWEGAAVTATTIRIETRDGWLYEQVDATGRLMNVVTAVDGNHFGDVWLSAVTT